MKNKILSGVVVGAITAIILIVVLTIAADLNPALKNWLKSVFSHHWIGKGILTMAVFVLSSFIVFLLPARVFEEKLPALLWLLFIVAATGAVLISGFYFYETLPAFNLSVA